MIRWLLPHLGRHLVHKTVRKQAQRGGLLDVRFGFALLRDRRIPIGAKLLALALGAGILALLVALELPIEGVVSLAMPLLGLPFAGFDGLEVIVGTLVLSALLLPRLAPKPLVTRLRAEPTAITQ